MLHVKLLCSWLSPEGLFQQWVKQTPGRTGKWGELQFSWDQPTEFYDFFVIINAAFDPSSYVPDRTFVFQMEPRVERLTHWNQWYSFQSDFLMWLGLDSFSNNHEWHLSLTYDQLKTYHPEKSKLISSVTSSQYAMEGHKLRVDFLKSLEQQIPVDIFGKSNTVGFQNYLGALPEFDKTRGLAAYKYSFAGENTSRIANYTTEKLIDCILCETLAFYSGPIGAVQFLNQDCFIHLDLGTDRIEKNVQKVLSAISTDEYARRRPAILNAKNKILEHTQIFPRLERLISLSKLNNLNGQKLTKLLKIPQMRPRHKHVTSFDILQIDHIELIASLDFVEKFAAVFFGISKKLGQNQICLISSSQIDNLSLSNLLDFGLDLCETDHLLVCPDIGFDIAISHSKCIHPEFHVSPDLLAECSQSNFRSSKHARFSSWYNFRQLWLDYVKSLQNFVEFVQVGLQIEN